ncbi:hypothetical protein [Syntrophothermus lipocalidus]|uniref:hypothetical protein n=1 Tax=Syntrophothermus lipocalidus TaxID=86170 RepID=UPI00059D20D1|nr:hypothetical protein [Syntrophothermus lipocalidus]
MGLIDTLKAYEKALPEKDINQDGRSADWGVKTYTNGNPVKWFGYRLMPSVKLGRGCRWLFMQPRPAPMTKNMCRWWKTSLLRVFRNLQPRDKAVCIRFCMSTTDVFGNLHSHDKLLP